MEVFGAFCKLLFRQAPIVCMCPECSYKTPLVFSNSFCLMKRFGLLFISLPAEIERAMGFLIVMSRVHIRNI